ncbi:cytochrome c-type biogenesis protein [Thermus thermophilus]|uniref:Cytochrome c-type biogenesis protein n=1 Tax=Thermus thermophilus (strain SG0.5JP17-16) TaxID=762633 RepID=F6DII6_THETG|nr:cytochrome c-type biogenesis protein CcmH [Thermus thermophilus]AEG33814.1 cytochrome C biogenesis protein [Thermus thermophilus SG0.5JP17-16]BBL82661.1 cytochrome c biogenesis protein [Thermus thermophilus]BBL84960.1 cytochrome c biogenesis protein [Thermus thermophilus]
MRWVVLLMAFLLPALAQEAPPPDLPPEVFRIARELRCPVCQGESAAESNSGVAVEMRRLIAEMLQEGKTEEEIKAFFVERYGEWILYAPPRRGVTLWVWVLPVLGLLLLGLGLFAYFRPRPLPKELLEEAERRLKEPPR